MKAFLLSMAAMVVITAVAWLSLQQMQVSSRSAYTIQGPVRN